MSEKGIFLNKYTLIIGDVGSGKTRYTANIIRSLIKDGLDDKIYIIDLAPNLRTLGYRLSKFIYGFKRAVYRYSRDIKAPRLEAKNPSMMANFIDNNYRIAKEFLEDFMESGRDILVINDVTIFLHKADVDELLKYIRKSNTFIGNGYLGYSIYDPFSTGLDDIERRRILELCDHMDNVIRLSSQSTP